MRRNRHHALRPSATTLPMTARCTTAPCAAAPCRPARFTRALRLGAVVAVLAALLPSCTNPYTPATGNGVSVYVVADHFHAGVLVQEHAAGGGYDYSLYTFGDRTWYLDGEMNAWTGMEALFVNSQAVLSTGRVTSTAGPEAVLEGVGLGPDPDGWRFQLTSDQLRDVRDYLNRQILADPAPVLATRTNGRFTVTYQPARRPYTGFYSCIQFAADFLNEAGIPFEPVWYYYTNDLLRDRLDQLTDKAF